MTDNAYNAPGPWYRQGWLWFVLAIPAVTIVLCIVMIAVAVRTQGSMVSDDYYKDGLGINMELARDRAAADLSLAGAVQFTPRRVRLNLEENGRNANVDFLVLNLSHPTLEERDRRLTLKPVGDGVYETDLTAPLEGRWYMDLRGPDNRWRLKGEAALPASETLPLRPAPQG